MCVCVSVNVNYQMQMHVVHMSSLTNWDIGVELSQCLCKQA